ncbi:MAG: ProQ/FINO family protein [Legionellales bacterium]
MNQQVHPVKKDKLQVIDWLIEHFPSAFFKKRNQVKPLQIGIFDDIIDFYERLESPPFSKKSLREALSYYSSSPAYLNCQKAHAARIDIYGNEVDEVTPEQAKYAHQKYQDRYMKKEETQTKAPEKPSNN